MQKYRIRTFRVGSALAEGLSLSNGRAMIVSVIRIHSGGRLNTNEFSREEAQYGRQKKGKETPRFFLASVFATLAAEIRGLEGGNFYRVHLSGSSDENVFSDHGDFRHRITAADGIGSFVPGGIRR